LSPHNYDWAPLGIKRRIDATIAAIEALGYRAQRISLSDYLFVPEPD
jgi:hypothetical protein